MQNLDTTAGSPDATKADTARETLLSLIGQTLERIHAIPEDELVDYPDEATNLLEQVEAWTAAFHREGYLTFRDPADEVQFLAPGTTL